MIRILRSASMALTLVAVVNNAYGQHLSLKDQVVGSWALISNETTYADGTKRQVFGPNPKGILMLGVEGRFSQVVVDPDRPKFKGNTRLDGTPEENKAVVVGTVAQFGTWSVDEATGILVVRIEGNLFPNDEGREQRRTFILEGDKLKQFNPTAGSGGRSETVWQRIK